MELLEYIMYNFGLQNEKAYKILLEIYENQKENLDEQIMVKIVRALNNCRGYTEYRVKDIALDLNFSKTKVKYLVKQLIDEGKLELITMENVTFLKPIF